AVHGNVDLAALKCLFQFLDENTFTADRRERNIRSPIARRANGHDLRWPSNPPGDFVGLPERELAAARADTEQRAHRSPKILRIVSRSESRSRGSVAESFSRRIG